MRLPAIYLVLAENQRENALSIELNGFRVCIHDKTESLQEFSKSLLQIVYDKSLWCQFSASTASIVDGAGGEKVINAIKAIELI
jgi:spore coat polysaccharide biosynthesis predicted glycosyltransferase SpsG